MSTKSLRARLVGLSAPSICWMATLGTVAAAPQQPAAPAPPPEQAAPKTPAGRVILLTDGRILSGELVEEGKTYSLRQKGGVLHLAKKQVDGVFDSVAEIYRHKVERVADDDPDEHRKLAQWCLSNKLHDEAKSELETVLALSPNDRQARAQLQALKSSEAKAASAQANNPPVDPEVARTAADGGVRSSRSTAAGPPAIFDLPPALALKRYQEFGLAVHPELQKRCAGCHNERSGLPFQLVKAASARDLRDDLLLRTNLDATLALIDRADPSRSPLLISAIVPHRGANNQSILGSAQNPSYRALAQWVAGVSSPNPQFEASPLLSGPAASSGGGFASQRGATTGSAPLPTFAPTPPSNSAEANPNGVPTVNPKSVTNFVRTGQVQPSNLPAGTQFPTPGLAPAGMPPLPVANPVAGGTTPGAAPSVSPRGAVPGTVPATAGQVPPGANLDPSKNPALAPMADPTRPDPKLLYPAEFDNPERKASKPKLNLDALEKFMRRDGNAGPK